MDIVRLHSLIVTSNMMGGACVEKGGTQLCVTANTYKTLVCGLHSTGAARVAKQVFNCYLCCILPMLNHFPALHQVFAFPSADGLKERRALYPLSARKQMDTSVHAHLSRLSPLLPLDPSRGGRDFLPQMAKKRPPVFRF